MVKREYLTIFLFFIFVTVTCGLPLRIVSLGPAVTNQLYELNASSMIVGDTIYCNIPGRLENIPKVGNVIDVNVEKIIRLNPDIVFATELSNERKCRLLTSLGIKVILIKNPKSFKELCTNFIKIGKIVGKEQLAKKIVHKANKEVVSIYNKVKNLKKIRVFFQIGFNPIFAAERDSFLNDYIKYAGGLNIVKIDRSGNYSIEKVIARKPDIIFITGMVGNNCDFCANFWNKYVDIPAVKDHRIYILPSNVCSPTPSLFPKFLREIAKLLHPSVDL